jgi:hypothetical protein
MQLTDRRIYFTWEDARRRDDVPLFKDDQNALVPSSPVAPSFAEQLGEPWPWVDLDFGRLDVRSLRGSHSTRRFARSARGHLRRLY